MQLLQAPGHSSRNVSPSHEDPGSWTSELLAQDQVASRHDPQLLAARSVPVDPYTAWLEQREAERRAGIEDAPARPARRRFARSRPASTPWFTVTVGRPDSR
jgi:hypothetical protein